MRSPDSGLSGGAGNNPAVHGPSEMGSENLSPKIKTKVLPRRLTLDCKGRKFRNMPEQNIKPTSQLAAAVSAAFRDYAPELHRYIARQMRHPEGAGDLTQEIFERFLQLPNPETVRNAQAFLYGIASNLVRELRYRERRSLVSFDSQTVDEVSERLEHADRDDLAERLALEQDLQWALSKLPAAHRAVLLLVKRDGLTYEEVAQRTGLALTTVTNYVSEARAKAKMLMKSRLG
jgi:RNA polymerase sigma-19 factor, ECF subfamily